LSDASAFEHGVRRVMSGEAVGPRAAMARAALAAASVPYAAATRVRNWTFDAGVRKAARLPRPVISVGNITTGGTGKTPVVRWLADRLRQTGETVAVLSRGYKARPGELGDEQRMLANLLNTPGQPPVAIRANPDRVAAGEGLLREAPKTSVILLDDGFQHRRLARDFDLVLIDATEPFGFGRVLPRGMLRESLKALTRASAFLVTRADQVDDARRLEIIERLRQHNPAAASYTSVHAPSHFRADNQADSISLEALRVRRWFAFCGIGGPGGFVRQLETIGGTNAGQRFFADHHDYTPGDLASLASEAKRVGADALVTTEKDWVKLAPLPRPEGLPPVWHLDIEIRFANGDDERALLQQILAAISRARGQR
jgi:tetraacyldisaccharide 4'-kinase